MGLMLAWLRLEKMSYWVACGTKTMLVAIQWMYFLGPWNLQWCSGRFLQPRLSMGPIFTWPRRLKVLKVAPTPRQGGHRLIRASQRRTKETPLHSLKEVASLDDVNVTWWVSSCCPPKTISTAVGHHRNTALMSETNLRVATWRRRNVATPMTAPCRLMLSSPCAAIGACKKIAVEVPRDAGPQNIGCTVHHCTFFVEFVFCFVESCTLYL